MLKGLKRVFGLLLAVTLAVTLLLPQGAFSALAAEEDSTDQTVTVSVEDEAGLIAALQNEATDVVINLTNDISISTAGTSTTGLHMSGTSEQIPYVNDYGITQYYTEITIYSRTIHGNGHTISVDEDYTPGSNSALIYVGVYSELSLEDVTIDGGLTDRCIRVSSDSTLKMHDGAVVENGGGSGSGNGIYLAGNTSYNSYLYMYEGSAVKNCVGGSGSTTVNGIGIYATYADLYLEGEISGCSVAESDDTTVTGAVSGGALYLYRNCNAYIYDTAKIQDNSVLGTEGSACGGAVYVTSNGNSVYMFGGTVSGNTAVSGGAFYFAGSGIFCLQGGEVSGNMADGGTGGAVYLSASTSLLIQDLQSDVSVTGNTASRDTGDGVGFGKGAGFYSIISKGEFTIDTGSSGYSVSVTDNYDIVTTTDEDGNTTQTSQTRDDIYQLYNPLDVSGSVEIGSIRMNEDAYLTLDGALTGGSIGIYPLDTTDGAVVAKAADCYCITGSDLNRLYSTDVSRTLTFDTDSNVIAKAISETDLSSATLTVNGVTYTGAPQEPTVSVLLNGSYLEEGTDFYTVYQDNTDVGTATVYVVGDGDYTGLAGTTFVIAAKDITDEDVSLATLGTYYTSDGTSGLEPDVELSYGDLSLENGTDYTLSYKDNAAVGTATVTITGTGNYTGTRTATFTIAEYALEDGQTASMVHNQEELETALLADSVTVILFANDISIDSKAEVARDVLIDGNGFTLSASAALAPSSSSTINEAVLSVSAGKLTLENITVAGGDSSMAARNLYIASGAEVILTDSVVMTGGYTGTTQSYGYGSAIYNAGILTLDGCVIRDGSYSGSVRAVYNASAGEITMKNGAVITNVGGSSGSAVYNAGTFTMTDSIVEANYTDITSVGTLVSNSGTFSMTGSVIDGMLADGETYVCGSTALVSNTGTFEMTESTFSHFESTATSTSNGGTVRITKGTFTMNSGSIRENKAIRGGGVLVNGGTFVMNGGTIENNEVYGEKSSSLYGVGAGVYLYSGTFTMSGGSIQNNTVYMLGSYAAANTAAGAGIYDYNGTLNLNGGSITGNSIVVNQTDVDSYGDTSGRGAGIYLRAYSTNTSLDISGTTISGNKIYTVEAGAEDDTDATEVSRAGTGIFIRNDSTTKYAKLSISGSGDISITDDVYLPSESNAFTINDTLLPEGRSVAISFTLPDDEAVAGRTVASYADGVEGSAADAACFTETSGLDTECYTSDSGSVIRIPSVEVEITDVQLSGEDTDTYTYVYDEDGKISGVYYTGTEIVPALTITAQYTDDNGTVQTVPLTDSQYTVTGSNNSDVTDADDSAVLTVSSTGTYDFDDFTVDFQIVKATAEQNVISFSNSSGNAYVEWDKDLNAYATSQIVTGSGDNAVSAAIQYLDGVVFGETSSIEGATVSIEDIEPLTGEGYTYAGPQDENDPIYADTFASTDLYGDDITVDGYTVNCVGTVKVTFTTDEDETNYEAGTQTLYVTIAKADQGLQYDEDLDITTPAQQGKINYYSISGDVYSTLDLGLKAYRIYNSYAYRRDTSSGVYSDIESSKSYDTDTELDTTITISYSTGTDVDGNTVYDTENPTNNLVYPVSEADSSTYDAAGTLIYLAKQGTATVVIQAAGNDYYNESSIALTSDTQNWVNGLGFTGNLQITVTGRTQTINGMTMAVGDGEAEELYTDADQGIYQASVDYVDVDGKSLTFTPSSDAVLEEGQEATIDYYTWNTSTKSPTGDGLTYAQTVDISISEDGKSLIVTPKAAGTVTFQVYMAAVGDYGQSGYQRVTLTINESTPELTYTLTDYDEDIVTVADDGTITACADSAVQVAFTTATDAASLALSYASSDTSVASVSSTESGSGVITITGLGDATATIAATGILGYKDVSVTIPVSTTLHQFGTDEVAYEWSDDYSTCSAVLTCESCKAEILVDCGVTATYYGEEGYVVETTDPDTGEVSTAVYTDVMVYTATAVYNDDTYSDTLIVEDTDCEHTYKALTYRWTPTDDGYTCTGTFKCSACGDTLVVTGEVAAESTATCMSAGTKTYTAVFDVEGQTFTRTLSEDEAATGHVYGDDVTFTWFESEDGSWNCTASRTCIYAGKTGGCTSDDESSTDTKDCIVTSETTTEAACTTGGEVVYTAAVTFDGTEYTDSKAVSISANGHSAVDLTDEGENRAFVWTLQDDGSYSCALYFYCADCGDVLTYLNAEVTSEVATAPTCTEAGEIIWTATAAYRTADDTYTFTDTMTAAAAATGHNSNGVNLETGERSCSVCGEVSTDTAAASVSVYLSESQYTYDGTAKEPVVAVLVDGSSLKEDEDFTVTYTSNTEVGTAAVTVEGTGNYSGTVTKTFRIRTAAVTVYNDVDYSAVYDYDYYVSNNPDVAAAYGGDTGAVLKHFVTYGMSEGRQGNEEFNVTSYAYKYADLRHAYKNDLASYYMHYIKYGKDEGRIATGTDTMQNCAVTYNGVSYSAVYDGVYYMTKYADLKKAFGFDDEGLLKHFVNYGMSEGRQANEEFNVTSYAYKYADLRHVYKNDLASYYMHYIKYGKDEGRVAVGTDTMQNFVTAYNGIDYAAVYDGAYYMDKYADLKKAYGLDDEGLLKHFVNCGMQEGRQASESFNVNVYRSKYADLQAAYGNDLVSYYLHYIKYGKDEGRTAVAAD